MSDLVNANGDSLDPQSKRQPGDRRYERYEIFKVCYDSNGDWSFDGPQEPGEYGTITVEGEHSLDTVLKMIKQRAVENIDDINERIGNVSKPLIHLPDGST
jgi:hypothetical protein